MLWRTYILPPDFTRTLDAHSVSHSTFVFLCTNLDFDQASSPSQTMRSMSPYQSLAYQHNSVISYTKIEIGETPWHGGIEHILPLPGGQRIITYFWHGSFQVWDLETGAPVGEVWELMERGVLAIALSPDAKTVLSGGFYGTVRLRNIDTGKVIKEWRHTDDDDHDDHDEVCSLCWSPDGERVACGFTYSGTFIVWDVESGRTVLGPIKAGYSVDAICYSPDAKMIATAGDSLNIWDASTGELLTTLRVKGNFRSLAWTSDGKTLIAGGSKIWKFDTVTWTQTAALRSFAPKIALSPNERMLASVSWTSKKVRLWNLETNKRIKMPLHHEDLFTMNCATFSADGMFLITTCIGIAPLGISIYKWDISGIVKEAGLSNNAIAKIKGACRILPVLFNDLFTSRTLWHHHFDSDAATDHGTKSSSSPFGWARNLVSGVLRR